MKQEQTLLDLIEWLEDKTELYIQYSKEEILKLFKEDTGL
jgi:hypothetical protein